MNMRKISLDVLIQLIGMLGILGGLVFVGLEMRQSQQLALAAQQTARMQVWTDIVNAFLNACSAACSCPILYKLKPQLLCVSGVSWPLSMASLNFLLASEYSAF